MSPCLLLSFEPQTSSLTASQSQPHPPHAHPTHKCTSGVVQGLHGEFVPSTHTHTHTHKSPTSSPKPRASQFHSSSLTLSVSHLPTASPKPPASQLRSSSLTLQPHSSSHTHSRKCVPGICPGLPGDWFPSHTHTFSLPPSHRQPQTSSLTVSQSQPHTPAAQFQPHAQMHTRDCAGTAWGIGSEHTHIPKPPASQFLSPSLKLQPHSSSHTHTNAHPGLFRDCLGCTSICVRDLPGILWGVHPFFFPGFSGVHILKSANDHPGLSGITLGNYIKHMTMRIRDCAGTVRGVHICLSGIYPGFSGVCIRLFSGILWGAHP